MTEVAKYLKIAVPTVSVAVQKGEQVVKDEAEAFEKLLNVNI